MKTRKGRTRNELVLLLSLLGYGVVMASAIQFSRMEAKMSNSNGLFVYL